MHKKFKKQILNRMNYASGHLAAVKRMIENDEYCIDVIKQNDAVIAALKKINALVLEDHLNTCVTEAIKGDKPKTRKKTLQELLDIYIIK